MSVREALLVIVAVAACGCGCGSNVSGGQVVGQKLDKSQLKVKVGETNADAVRRMMKAGGGSGIPKPGSAAPGQKYGIPK